MPEGTPAQAPDDAPWLTALPYLQGHIGDLHSRRGDLANAETRVIYRQESDQITGAGTMLGLTGTERKLIPGLGTGQGLWRIKERSFLVQAQLTPDELQMFQTDTRLMGDGETRSVT